MDWTMIGCRSTYIATQTYRRWGKNEMPTDITVDSLTDDQMRELNRLKDWLYRKRTQIRLERDQVERRQRKEEEAARRKAEQPALSLSSDGTTLQLKAWTKIHAFFFAYNSRQV